MKAAREKIITFKENNIMKDHQLLLRNYGNHKKGPLEAECVGPLKQVMLGILDFKYEGKF